MHLEGANGCPPILNGIFGLFDWLQPGLLDVPYDPHNLHVEGLYSIPDISIFRALDKQKVNVDALHIDVVDEN